MRQWLPAPLVPKPGAGVQGPLGPGIHPAVLGNLDQGPASRAPLFQPLCNVSQQSPYQGASVSSRAEGVAVHQGPSIEGGVVQVVC